MKRRTHAVAAAITVALMQPANALVVVPKSAVAPSVARPAVLTLPPLMSDMRQAPSESPSVASVVEVVMPNVADVGRIVGQMRGKRMDEAPADTNASDGEGSTTDL